MSFLPSFRSLPLTTRLPLAGSSVNTPLAAAGVRSLSSTSLRLRAPVPSSPLTPPRSAGSHSATSGASGSGQGSSSSAKRPTPTMVWYREIVPAMVPILLLSTTIFLSLSLLRTHLSHAKSLEESSARIAELEGELDRVKRQQRRAIERERKQRERILPIVVEKVLQKVGAMQGSEHEEDEEDVKHAPLLV
ncbi:hypothetical protein EHS25_006446 [Saitozyma podzolica]|uniref:Uncharacterized protein n=1 Tax=Saitozyma podzolica TaxID=1890683 RepID=A0A427YRP3_9TREE|nr:hypothetical protein EHS25_006446 [Saitozyma podzolica]